MQYLSLAAFNELGNGFVNDWQVDIAVMCISLRSVMTCSKMCIRDRVEIEVMGISLRSVMTCSNMV